jgi:hypothetical protein
MFIKCLVFLSMFKNVKIIRINEGMKRAANKTI